MENPAFIPYESGFDPGCPSEQAAAAFYEVLKSRRSIRDFSDRPVSRETIEWIVRAATTAPNGANKQPWRFVAVQDSELKRKIRIAAEKEERELYATRASDEWLAPVFFSGASKLFSGVCLVSSARSNTEPPRRPGEVGL
jgi:nitroreductase